MLNAKWCLKAAIADNGNEPLLPWERARAELNLDCPREITAATVSPANLLGHAGRRREYAFMRDPSASYDPSASFCILHSAFCIVAHPASAVFGLCKPGAKL
jgi:hypothetical protein